jgi:uncharacterized protein YjaZ
MEILNLPSSELRPSHELLNAIQQHTEQIWMCSSRPANTSSAQSFLSWLNELQSMLEASNLDTSNILCAIMDKCSTSNGHAFLWKEKAVVWFSASNYPTPKTIEVFATHEVIHAIHYLSNPDFCFNSAKEKNHVGRQLVTEGVATYITQQLLQLTDSEALWADYLVASDLEVLMKEYDAGKNTTASRILTAWDADDQAFFTALNRENIDEYRSGYFIGRLIVEKIMKEQGFTIQELLMLPRPTFEEQAKEILRILQVASHF